MLGAWVTHQFFDVPWLLAFVSLPLIFVLTVIATNSMALTSWTPTGALSKITQFTMGAIDRTNPASNLIPAGMTGEIAANSANLLSDIKPGICWAANRANRRLACDRHIRGAIACVPVLCCFLPPDATACALPRPGVGPVRIPRSIAVEGRGRVIAKGLTALPYSAIVSMVVAAVSAAAIEIARIATKNRFPLSAVSIGLGVVLPPEATFAMWVGAMVFWLMGKRYKAKDTRGHEFWVEGLEPICAGLISGAALMGIGNAIVNVLMN